MLSINNFSLRYGKEVVLKNISFHAGEGEITVILGPNGVGKSSMLKSLCGINKYEGQVVLDEEVLSTPNRGNWISKISYLSQENNCNADLTVFEIILLGLMDRLSLRVGEEEISKVEDIIHEMNIEKIATKNISKLSGGQRQMVFIAQALVKKPRVLLMDEPISSLDLYRQYELLEYIRHITKENSIITVMTLHHIDMASQFSDRIVILKDGAMYDAGLPHHIITTKMLSEVYQIKAKIVQEDGLPHIISIGAC